MILLNLNAVYACCGRTLPDPELDPDAAALVVRVWAEACEVIPTEWLDRVFKAARLAHRSTFLMVPGAILDAWDALITERQAAAAQTDPARLLPGPGQVRTVPCAECAGAGWLRSRQGKAGARPDLIPCHACGRTGQTTEGAEAPTYAVQALLPVLTSFCAEHRDPLPGLVILAYALACAKAGLFAADVRRILEAGQEPTLYAALYASGVPVEPPPPPPTAPQRVGTWQRANVEAAL